MAGEVFLRFGARGLLRGALLVGASVVVVACQSSGQSPGKGSPAPTTVGQAQAAFYDCLDSAFDAPVPGTGGNRAVANRFINRCNGELADWEEALIAGGTPPDQAEQMIDTVRDNLRDEIANNLSGPI